MARKWPAVGAVGAGLQTILLPVSVSKSLEVENFKLTDGDQ